MNKQVNFFSEAKRWALLASLFTFVCIPMQGFTINQGPGDTNFTAVARKATPAVVSIQVKIALGNRSSQFFKGREYEIEDPFDFFNDDFFQRFFGQHRREHGHPQQRFQSGQASGFIVSDDGYILTNGHVVQNADEISVGLNDEREFEGKVIGIDLNTDIAVIKIEAKGLPYLTLGNSDALEVGQWVMAIGNPLGLQASVTAGVVSAKGRNNLDLARIENFIQTDASINRGNSGGPLLNLNGEVIGMNTAIITSIGTGGYMGIGFSIPSNLAQHVMQELIENGSVTRGFMGVTLQQINNDLAQAFELNTIEGALVSDIAKDSPAEKAGLKQGDIILEYNNKKVSNTASLRNAVSLMKPGSNMNLTILRDGRKISIPLTVGTYPEESPQASIKEDKLAIEVEPLTPQIAQNLGYTGMSGVVVSKVEQGSPAAWAGIKKGSLIVAVNHVEVKSVDQFHQLVNNADATKPILFLIKQGEYMRFVSIKVD